MRLETRDLAVLLRCFDCGQRGVAINSKSRCEACHGQPFTMKPVGSRYSWTECTVPGCHHFGQWLNATARKRAEAHALKAHGWRPWEPDVAGIPDACPECGEPLDVVREVGQLTVCCTAPPGECPSRDLLHVAYGAVGLTMPPMRTEQRSTRLEGKRIVIGSLFDPEVFATEVAQHQQRLEAAIGEARRLRALAGEML